MKTWVLLIILIFLVTITIYYRSESTENFTENFADVSGISTLSQISNEAISNIASVYNDKDMKLNKLQITQDLNVDGNAAVRGSYIVAGKDKSEWVLHTPNDDRRGIWIARKDANNWNWDKSLSYDTNTFTVNGNQTVSGNISGNILENKSCDFILGKGCDRGSSGNSRALVKDTNSQLVVNYGNDFTGGTRIDGNLNVGGVLYEKVIIIAPVAWARSEFVKKIKDGGYFKNKPDGTLLKFLFVHPGADLNMENTANTNRWFWYGQAIKYGKQFLLYELQPEHGNPRGVPDPQKNTSNDLSWRGDIE